MFGGAAILVTKAHLNTKPFLVLCIVTTYYNYLLHGLRQRRHAEIPGQWWSQNATCRAVVENFD